MISPYRLQNNIPPDSPEDMQKHKHYGNTSAHNATAIHKNTYHTTPKANNLFYRSPSRDIRMKPVEVLDISKIDHEAIRNDGDLKKLSRNPAAFNTNSIEDDMYEEEDTSDDDLFADEERLVENPSEEQRLRTFLSQTSSLSNQNVPRTPKTYSFASGYSSDRNSRHYLDDPISIPSKDNIQSQSQQSQQPQQLNWKDHIVNFMLKMLRACVFQFFMIYWIIKEPIIRTITFFTMIVSFILVDPIIFISTMLSSQNHNWVPSSERRGQIASVCTLILFIFFFMPSLRGYVNDTAVTTFDYVQATARKFMHDDQSQSNFDPVFYHKLKNDNSKLWTAIKKLETDVTGLRSVDKDILSQLTMQQSNYKDQQAQIKDQQNQLTTLKQSLDNDIRKAIRDQLPEMIFINTNESGQLELSPQFYKYLKDTSFWKDFLKENDAAIREYFSDEMTDFLNQQKKEGAVIGRDAFMKLLSDTLMQNHGDINEVSFNNLVDKAIKKYHQDILNIPDFASSSRGAQVLYSLTTSTYYPHPGWVQGVQKFLGVAVIAKTPEMALRANSLPGECWQMFKNKGQIGILLSERIMIKGITIEYPSKEIMANKMEAAPKEIELYGLAGSPESEEDRIFLARFTYDVEKDDSIQTFDVKDVGIPFRAVLVQFKSNYGCKDHTDIYRIRIHGDPA